MMELNVIVDFACCLCAYELNVELRCTGKGLAAYPGAVAAVRVTCPDCGNTNQVYFEPNGTVRAVSPIPPGLARLEPSIN